MTPGPNFDTEPGTIMKDERCHQLPHPCFPSPVVCTVHIHMIIIVYRMRPIFIFISRETCKMFKAVEIRFGPLT